MNRVVEYVNRFVNDASRLLVNGSRTSRSIARSAVRDGTKESRRRWPRTPTRRVISLTRSSHKQSRHRLKRAHGRASPHAISARATSSTCSSRSSGTEVAESTSRYGTEQCKERTADYLSSDDIGWPKDGVLQCCVLVSFFSKDICSQFRTFKPISRHWGSLFCHKADWPSIDASDTELNPPA